MAEVIDLLSSPIVSPARSKHRLAALPNHESPPADIFTISSDDLNSPDISDHLDVLPTRPNKKRRLSPSKPRDSPARLLRNLGFISSDDELALGETSITRTTTPATTADIKELLSDPITFSSSGPAPRRFGQEAKPVVIELNSDSSNDEDIFSFLHPQLPSTRHLSERTANLLANIPGISKGGSKHKGNTRTVKSNATTLSTASSKTRKRPTAEDDIVSSSPPKQRLKSSKAPARDNDARNAERAAAKAKKEAEKEAEKERKRLTKEEKAREKQVAADIAEVNKAKTEKKNSTPEMIVDMARSFEGTSVGNQVLEYMKILEVETTFFDEHLELSTSSDLPTRKGNLVRWRRKIKAKYNDELGYWEPIPVEKIETEKHILLHLTAQEFLEIAALDLRPNLDPAAQEKAMTKNLDAHVTSLRVQYKDCTPIYLIEGLTTFLRKNQNAKNRAYTAAVRSQMPTTATADTDPSSTTQPRRKKPATATPSINLSSIDFPLTESLFLHLQLRHPALLIHHTPTPSLTASTIKSLTESISTLPYRRARMTLNDAVGFCMDVGQVKTGDDAKDTFVRMLQEVVRVTPAMAYGIAEEVGGVRGLVDAFRTGGPEVLQEVRKGSNRDGGLSERVLGKMISRRLYKVWMGREEGETDGMG